MFSHLSIAGNISGTYYSDIYGEVCLIIFFVKYYVQLLMKLPEKTDAKCNLSTENEGISEINTWKNIWIKRTPLLSFKSLLLRMYVLK